MPSWPRRHVSGLGDTAVHHGRGATFLDSATRRPCITAEAPCLWHSQRSTAAAPCTSPGSRRGPCTISCHNSCDTSRAVHSGIPDHHMHWWGSHACAAPPVHSWVRRGVRPRCGARRRVARPACEIMQCSSLCACALALPGGRQDVRASSV